MFVMPAIMGGVAGPAFIVSIILVGLIVMILGLAYSELGATYPIEGGPYSLPRKAMGDLSGFVMGWGYFIYAFTGTAAIIFVFVNYLAYFIPGLANEYVLTPLGIGVALVALAILTVINIMGVRYGVWYSMITTLGKMVALVLFAIIGLTFFKMDNFSPFIPIGFGLGGIGLAMAFDFFAFTGFEAVVIPNAEVKDPGRNIPRAMIISVLVVVAIYVLISVAFIGMFNWGAAGIEVGDWGSIGGLASPLATAANSVALPILVAIVVIGALISSGGASGDWVLLQGRMPYSMANNKLFWAPLAEVDKKYRTPVKALIFASILTAITMILLPAFPQVALLASITTLVPYAAAALALPILRKTDPKTKRPFKLYGATAIAVLGFIFSTFLVYWASWPWTLVGAGLMLLGYPLFILVKGERPFELTRNLWLIAYLAGIIIMSYIGDPTFIYQNFLPIEPLGLLVMPYDLLVLTVFSLAIFAWAYKTNIEYPPMTDDQANE